MNMHHRMGFLAVVASAMACADPAGLDRTLVPGSPSFDVTVNPATVGTLLPGDLTAPGRVRVCKTTPTGDPALTWTFSIQVTGTIGGAAPAPTWDGSITGVSGQTVCETAYTSVKSGDGLDQVVITEQALPANWTLDHIHIQRFMHGAGPYTPPAAMPLDAGNLTTRVATLYVNGDMLRDVTYENNFTAPPPDICTYTKGWYQNNNGKPTVIAVDGRTIAQAQAIFEASPGQPGSVTWGVGALTDNKPNNLLNLYQQFLAALQNLGGDANEDLGPTAVDNAIDAVQAGTGGTGTHISTTLTKEQISAYIDVLSAFNQGEYAGFPHCSDEVIID